MASDGMRTPRCGSEITEAWVQHMLTCYERRRDPQAAVKVINYHAKKGTKPGENLASELIKIWAEVELTGRRKEETVVDKEDMEEDKGGKDSSSNTKKKEKEKEEAEEEKREKERENQEGNNKEEEDKTEKGNNSTANTNSHATNTTTTSSSTTTSTKEYHLVAKFNAGTEMDIAYVKYMNQDLNELLIYSEVIAHLNTWQEQVLREKGEEGEALDRYKVRVPEFVYGVCTYDEYVLVMQDVSVLGYTTQDKMQGLDLPHVLMAADRLARLHALSHAFHKTHGFLQHYPSFVMDDRVWRLFVNFLFVTVDFTVEMASQRPEFAPIVEKMRGNREDLIARLEETGGSGDPKNRVVCLAHGDYWTNNLMYSHERTNGEANTPQDLMLIDWGLLNWRNPILDLHQLVYNCTTRSLRRLHLQDILHRYHSTFTAATTALGAPVAGYSFEELLQEWRRTATFGFLSAGLFANAIVLSHKAVKAYSKGSPSSGLKGAALRMMGKVMVRLVLRGWLKNVMINDTKEKFQPLFEEMLSGENHLLTSRLLDLMEEAYQEGVLDE